MKKNLLGYSLLLGTAMGAQAQNNVAKINTASVLLQTGSVFFEHRLSDAHSLNLGVFVTNYNSQAFGGELKNQCTGFGLTAEYRTYTGKNALRGFFIGPYLRLQNFDFTKTITYPNNPVYVDKASLTTVGGGLVCGWQGIIGNRFSIEPFLGVGYAAGEVQNDSNGDNLEIRNGIRGFELRPGLNIGFAFGRESPR